MQSTVGPVRSVQMSYTATGKSTGQATVVFKNKGDANKAHAACGSDTHLSAQDIDDADRLIVSSDHNRMVDNR